MIRATVVSVTWDKVEGATGYDIYRDGVKVSSTKTALTARLGVPMGETVFEIRAKGSAIVGVETITLRQQT